MSGRVAANSQCRRTRAPRSLLAPVLFAVAAAGLAPAQDVKDAQDPGSPIGGHDPRPPLPPTDPKRAELLERLRVPNPDRAIFRGQLDAKGNRLPNTGVEDFTPFVGEKKNRDEYDAWREVLAHARQFDAATLEAEASADLTRDELLGAPRFHARLGLHRFDGKVTKVRRVSPAGADEAAYEALLVPLPEPPGAVVSVVFADWPAGLGAEPGGEWRAADAWATAAGYFFKVKQDAPGEPAIPVLVGRGVTVRPAAPVAAGANPAALDRSLRVFRAIRDDARVARAEDNPEEVWAWNRVLLHARRFAPEELERHATPVTFADLFTDARRDLKLDLVKVEGRLLMLETVKPGEKLKAAGVGTVYEGWIVPRDTPGGNPVCAVFTDPPEGVEATGRVNKWVSFAGFSFKLFRYKSGERDKDDPNGYVTKRAPLLLGRAVLPRPDPEAPSRWSWGAGFVPALVGLIGGGLAVALAVAWWFRRGDRAARQEIDARRGRNPFGEPAA